MGAAAKASSGGGSLFDIGGDSEDSADDSAGEEMPANADDRAPSAPAEEPPSSEKTEDKSADKSGDEGFGGGSLFDLGGDDSSASEEPAAEPKVEETGGEVDRSEDDADADVTPEGETEAVTKTEDQSRVAGRSRSRWRDLHPRHRDPRGRLAVRHRRTRGVRTGREVRARCRAGRPTRTRPVTPPRTPTSTAARTTPTRT